MKKSSKLILIITGGLVLLIAASILIYSLDYYAADDGVMSPTYDGVSVEANSQYIAIEPNDEYSAALIYYPGGKVEHSAYIPFCAMLANRCNIAVFIVKMPLKLAVLNYSAGETILQLFPDVQQWYIGGHSLGGAMASKFYAQNPLIFEGLILLGSYAMEDCDNSLSIYGSNDTVVDVEKAKRATKVFEIEGGNHAYFGNYGEQEGDGEATISREQQQSIAVEEIFKFLAEE